MLLGLEIARYTEKTNQKLREILPAVGTTAANPTDIGAGVLVNPSLYGQTAKILLEDENVDMLITVTGPDNPDYRQGPGGSSRVHRQADGRCIVRYCRIGGTAGQIFTGETCPGLP